MTRYRRCPACGRLAEVPSDGATAFACPGCGAEVPLPADDSRRAVVRAVEPVALPIRATARLIEPPPKPVVMPTVAEPARPSSGAAWRVGALFVLSLASAVGFTGHIIYRVLSPEPVAEALPATPPAAVPAPAVPTNLGRVAPAVKPTRRVAPPAEPPEPVVPEWREEWTPFEPEGLGLRVSLPGERRRRTVQFPQESGLVVPVPEDAGDEGPMRYRVLTLQAYTGATTPSRLARVLAGLRPDDLAPPVAASVAGRKGAKLRFLAYDGREWTAYVLPRGPKVAVLVASLDRAAVPRYLGFDEAAGLKRFLDSVEWLGE